MVQPTQRSVFVRVVVPLLLLTLTMPSVAAAQSGIRAYILGIASAGPGAEAQIVTVLDTTTNAVVTTIPAGAGCTCLVDAERMAISPDGTRLYVVSRNKATNQDSILIIRTASNTVIDTISIDRIANTVVVSPSGGRLYVAGWSPSGQSLMVLDTATKATITSIPSGDGGRGMAISPDGSRIYTSGIDTDGSTYLPENQGVRYDHKRPASGHRCCRVVSINGGQGVLPREPRRLAGRIAADTCRISGQPNWP